MAGSNLLPLLALGGVAAYTMTRKKKKSGAGTMGTKKAVAAEGTMSGYEWRVREATKGEGFAIEYLAEIRKIGGSWESLGFRATIDDATLIAKEAIAADLAEAAEKAGHGFNWEPAIAVNQEALRKEFPGVTLTRLQSGEYLREDKKCNWAVCDTSPPIPGGPYFGIGICPGIPQDTVVGQSIAAVMAALEVE